MNRQFIKIIEFLMVIPMKCIPVYVFVGKKFTVVVLKMNLDIRCRQYNYCSMVEKRKKSV